MRGARPGKGTPLQPPASEERELAEYEKWVRDKVSAARADTRPGMTTGQLRQQLLNR